MIVDLETLLTIATIALWLLFPLSIFFSVGYLDRTTKGHEQHLPLKDKLVAKPRRSEATPPSGFHLPHWGMRH